MGLGSWISRAWDKTVGAAGRGIKSAYTSVTTTHPMDTIKNIGSGISTAYDKTLGAAGRAIGDHVFTPIMEDPWRCAAVAVTETGNFIVHTATDPIGSTKLVGQGLAYSVASTAGMVVDLGAGVINLGFDPKDKIGYDPKTGEKLSSFADYYKEGVTFIDTENLNGYQKTLLYGTQAVGEVAAFAAVTAVTAGAGGTAWASVRGGAYVARGASFAKHANLIGRGVKIVDTAADFGKAAKAAGGLLRQGKALSATGTVLKGSGRVVSDLTVKSGSLITKPFTAAAKLSGSGAKLAQKGSRLQRALSHAEGALGHGAKMAGKGWRFSMPLGGQRTAAGIKGRNALKQAEKLDEGFVKSLYEESKLIAEEALETARNSGLSETELATLSQQMQQKSGRILKEALENVDKSNLSKTELKALKQIEKAHKKFDQFDDDLARRAKKAGKLEGKAENLRHMADDMRAKNPDSRYAQIAAEEAEKSADKLIAKADLKHFERPRVTKLSAGIETVGGGLSMGMNFAEDAAKAAEAAKEQETPDMNQMFKDGFEQKMQKRLEKSSAELHSNFEKATGWAVFNNRDNSAFGQSFSTTAQASVAQPANITFVHLRSDQQQGPQAENSQFTAA